MIHKTKKIIGEYDFSFKKGYLSVRDEIAFDLAVTYGFDNDYIGLMQKKRTPKETIDLAKTIKAQLVQIRPKSWIDDDWQQLSKSNLKFTIFYTDTEEEFQFYSKRNPYGIFTNFPSKFL